MPVLLKLHGSSNWRLKSSGEIQVVTEKWSDFLRVPGYRASGATLHSRARYPIILPFWEKPIEEEPWIGIWKGALQQLQRTDILLVWGYSLPTTDVKTRHLFSLGIDRARVKPLQLCVIDPSADTQKRWREIYPTAHYWKYDSFEKFFSHQPEWWQARESYWPS